MIVSGFIKWRQINSAEFWNFEVGSLNIEGHGGMVGFALAHNPVLMSSNPLDTTVKEINIGFFFWSQHLWRLYIPKSHPTQV